MLFIGKVLRNIRFSPHFYCCLQGVKFVMTETNSNFILSQQILIFLHKIPYISPFSQKAIGVFCHKSFLKHQRFTICLLVLAVVEVYNISNKYQLPHKSVKYLLFYTKDLTLLLHFQQKLAFCIAKFPINIHFLPNFY